MFISASKQKACSLHFPNLTVVDVDTAECQVRTITTSCQSRLLLVQELSLKVLYLVKRGQRNSKYTINSTSADERYSL